VTTRPGSTSVQQLQLEFHDHWNIHSASRTRCLILRKVFPGFVVPIFLPDVRKEIQHDNIKEFYSLLSRIPSILLKNFSVSVFNDLSTSRRLINITIDHMLSKLMGSFSLVSSRTKIHCRLFEPNRSAISGKVARIIPGEDLGRDLNLEPVC
jgi:hypothetical protein